MRIDGLWFLCDDGVVRPIVRGEALGADGHWQPVDFLVDTGADSTVFSSDVCAALGLPPGQAGGHLLGLGGPSEAEIIAVEFRLRQDDATPVTFRGQFRAVCDPQALDMSVLGRDILNLFAVILDRSQEVVCLIAQRHRYVIVEQ